MSYGTKESFFLCVFYSEGGSSTVYTYVHYNWKGEGTLLFREEGAGY